MPLDIALGMWSAFLISKLFNLPLTTVLLFFGIGFALLPDVDYFWYIFRTRGMALVHRHRELLHNPLLYIPVGTMVLASFDFPLAGLFILASFLHFIHDSIGIGWGVRWLYPLSKKQFAFFYLYQPAGKELLPRHLLYAWSPEELKIWVEKYGDDNWARNIYVRLHPYALIEIMGFLGTIAFFYFRLK